MNSLYAYYVSGNASTIYPTILYFGLLRLRCEPVAEIPKYDPYKEEWGGIISSYLLIEGNEMPDMIDMVYLSLVERKFYSIEKLLPQQQMQQAWNRKAKSLYTHVVVGMAPYGKIAIWFKGDDKSLLLDWIDGVETYVDPSELFSTGRSLTLDEICDFYINTDPRVRSNLDENGLPPRDLFNNYMKQFTYRYQVEFGHWDEKNQTWNPHTEEEKEKQQLPELDFIEEALFDGTHDKLHDGGLMKYHEAGKPKKLAVQWHVGKKEWTAYFWFEDQEIRNVFDRFYGTHPDNKADLVLRVDQEKNRYELSLFRYGLPEPRVISERAYQLLVFRNKFECFRSANYNQEHGAWIW